MDINPPAIVCNAPIVDKAVVDYFVINLITNIREHTLRMKGLTWHDHSELLAYKQLKDDPYIKSLIEINGVWPVRDMYGPQIKAYRSVTYQDVEYRLVPIQVWYTLYEYMVYNLMDSIP